MPDTCPIRQLAAACLTFCMLVTGLMLLNLDQPDLRAKLIQGGDFGRLESVPVDHDVLEEHAKTLDWKYQGNHVASVIGSSLCAIQNEGFDAPNVDLVMGTTRH